MIPSLNNQDSIEKGFLFFWLYLDIETLGGGFKDFYVHPYFGEMIQFDEHIFQVGWFNHQLETAMYERLICSFPWANTTPKGHAMPVECVCFGVLMCGRRESNLSEKPTILNETPFSAKHISSKLRGFFKTLFFCFLFGIVSF